MVDRGTSSRVHTGDNSSYPTAAVAFRNDTIFPDSATSGRVGININGAWQPSIAHSRIVGGYDGILLSVTDAAVTTTIDTTAVSATGWAGIELTGVPGAVSGVLSNISGNLWSGVSDQSGAAGHSLTLGQFVGNGSYSVLFGSSNTFDATNNWWGGVAGGDSTGVNSVSGNVQTLPALAAPLTGLPLLAPRLFATGAAAPLLTTSPPASAPAAAPRPVLPRVAAPGRGCAANGPASQAPGGARTGPRGPSPGDAPARAAPHHAHVDQTTILILGLPRRCRTRGSRPGFFVCVRLVTPRCRAR